MSNPNSDQLWQQFLQSIYDDKQDDEGEEEGEEEEEVNDPEYSISEDLLNFEDDWDFSDERAFKVSDYELDLLLDEEDNEMEVQTVESAITTTEVSPDDTVFTKESVQILVTQMSQHIQLLTQSYVQSRNTMGLQSVATNSASMLNELNVMSQKNPLFSPIRLTPVIDLIGHYPIDSNTETRRVTTSWRTLPVTKENQKIFISNPSVFIHTWLLPFCGFYDQKDIENRRKTVFTLAEDHLIALGLEQLNPLFSLRKCYRYLKQLLLPTKTVDQIRTHIKNIKRRSSANDSIENPIMFYYTNGRAPETHSGIVDPKLDTYLFYKTLPEWYKKSFKSRISRKDQTIGYRLSDRAIEAKRLKSGTTVCEYKRLFPTNQQSPVKQTTLIVKKYKYLNRLNHVKQNLSLSPQKKKELADDKHKTCEDTPSKTNISDEIKSETNVAKNEIQSTTTKDTQNKSQNSDLDSDGVDQQKQSQSNDISICEEDMECDDESALAALMTASSTITIKNKAKSSKNANDSTNSSTIQINQSRKEGRKSLAVKQRESTLQLLSFETNQTQTNCQQRDEILIQNFMEKVRKCLTHESYVNFLSLLSDFHRNRAEDQLSPNKGLIREHYSRIEDFLKKSNVSKEIISEFVLFLSAEQAEECGKMFDYLYWKRVFNFVNKIERYSLIDSQCLSRFYRCLNQLKSNTEDLDYEKIRQAVNRSLNGQSYLMHHFSSLLLSEKPSKYLFGDNDFDEVVIDSSDDEERTDSFEKTCFENINIPETDDDLKYGTNECPCNTCHKDPSQPITNHCTSCSIRFIGGRVYLTQNHKKFGLAEISFSDKSDEFCNDNKLSEDAEEVTVESDKEADGDSIEKSLDSKGWTMNEDKLLLELCRFKVMEEKRTDLNEDVFEEVATKLAKDTADVISRFNKLMELFASEHETNSGQLSSD